MKKTITGLLSMKKKSITALQQCSTVQETGVSRHYGDLIKGPSEIPQTSRQYATKGLKGSPIKPQAWAYRRANLNKFWHRGNFCRSCFLIFLIFLSINLFSILFDQEYLVILVEIHVKKCSFAMIARTNLTHYSVYPLQRT